MFKLLIKENRNAQVNQSNNKLKGSLTFEYSNDYIQQQKKKEQKLHLRLTERCLLYCTVIDNCSTDTTKSLVKDGYMDGIK